MPTSTYVGIANITLGSAAASVTFSSISQAYRDLVLVCTVAAGSNQDIYIALNSDTTNGNYSCLFMAGDGSSASSSTGTRNLGYAYTSATDHVHHIMDYSATDKHKTILLRYGNAANFTAAKAQRWANTAAVTSVSFTVPSTTFSAGSTFSLFGVAA